MNGILVGENETVADEDAVKFYLLISTCIEQVLDSLNDKIVITKPDRPSRSAQSYMLHCQINEDRFVSLKRCCDNHEFMRREMAVAVAKRQLGFPGYNVLQINGLTLRNAKNMASCSLLNGWEQKTMLVVDFGKYRFSKNLHELSPNQINDLRSFFYSYGLWAAFNYLLTIRDRNAGNFIFFTDTQVLHSIDNEEGPFDSNGIDGGVLDIVVATRQHIEKFIEGPNREEYVLQLRKGFSDGLSQIAKQCKKLDMFQPREYALIRQRLENAPPNLASAIFP